MNKAKLKKYTISLSELSKNNTTEERKFVDAEKQYYQVILTLRKKREALGLTQEKLAQLSHLPRTTVTKVESGSRNATLQTLSAMAEAMEKNIELRLL